LSIQEKIVAEIEIQQGSIDRLRSEINENEQRVKNLVTDVWGQK
jgi:hypothetical protein